MSEDATSPRKVRLDAQVRRTLVARLLASGMKTSEIAEELGISVRTVQDIMTESELREAVMDAKEAALEVLREAGADAARALVSSLGDGEQARDRNVAAIAILDRIGVIKSEGREVTGKGGAPLAAVLMTAEERDAWARKGE